MFIIDKEKNEANMIPSQKFSDLGFREREHLQEWIANNPAMLGEELLIIGKEFDEWDYTNERLDLLALDADGNLVIIENKRDDSGKDVTWQALKYVSYCSTIKHDDVVQIFQNYLDKSDKGKKAEDELREFFEQRFSEIKFNQDQRIILVAANFRQEVTSTVLWLFSRGVRIKCIKITPYLHEVKIAPNSSHENVEMIFVDTEQIIPVKDTEDYLIKLAQKTQQENRERVVTDADRLHTNFWNELLPRMNEKTTLFKNAKSWKNPWMTSVLSLGIWYELNISNYSCAKVQLNIQRKEITKQIFDYLYQRKDEIESKIGVELDWQRRDEKPRSRIEFLLPGISITNTEDWDKIIEFFVEKMIKLAEATKDILHEILNELESEISEE